MGDPLVARHCGFIRCIRMETTAGNSIYVPIQSLDSLLRLTKAVSTARVILRCGCLLTTSAGSIIAYIHRDKKKKKKTTTSQERQDLNKKKQILNNNE